MAAAPSCVSLSTEPFFLTVAVCTAIIGVFWFARSHTNEQRIERAVFVVGLTVLSTLAAVLSSDELCAFDVHRRAPVHDDSQALTAARHTGGPSRSNR
ncbi:hypothetical protein [Longimycelium tulufanense]|uniref:hypothetical protein n=1 Tax=Longimycelium tulufanense TaxID=907463 RepID=UPI001667A1C7|nr:hypothetical protein [Longimycelium tulufanense]